MKITGLTGAAALIASACALGGNAHALDLDLEGKVSVSDVAEASAGGFDLNGDLAYGAAIGLDGLGPFRAELGYTNLSANALGAVDISADALALIAYIDIPVTDKFSVFGGVGYEWMEGSANVGFGSIDFNGDGHLFAAGGRYALSDTVSLEISWTQRHPDLGFADAEITTAGAALVFDL